MDEEKNVESYDLDSIMAEFRASPPTEPPAQMQGDTALSDGGINDAAWPEDDGGAPSEPPAYDGGDGREGLPAYGGEDAGLEPPFDGGGSQRLVMKSMDDAFGAEERSEGVGLSGGGGGPPPVQGPESGAPWSSAPAQGAQGVAETGFRQDAPFAEEGAAAPPRKPAPEAWEQDVPAEAWQRGAAAEPWQQDVPSAAWEQDVSAAAWQQEAADAAWQQDAGEAPWERDTATPSPRRGLPETAGQPEAAKATMQQPAAEAPDPPEAGQASGKWPAGVQDVWQNPAGAFRGREALEGGQAWQPLPQEDSQAQKPRQESAGPAPPMPGAEAPAGEPWDFDTAPDAPETDAPAADGSAGSGGTLRERVLSPLIALMALITMRREKRAGGEDKQPTVEEEDAAAAIPEPTPEKAVKFYGAQVHSLHLRGRLSAAVCVVMLYLSFAYYTEALPLTGALGNGIRPLALLLLILELTVAMIGLDVFTGGLLGIVRLQMGAESLVSASCILSMLDAAVIAARNEPDYGLPFCAISAISLCFAVWGAYFTCQGRRSSFRVLASSKLYAVTAERDLAEKDVALLKSTRDSKGFIRRSEEADVGEYAYGLLTPFLLLAALLLGPVAGLVRGQPGSILHCISILSAASATFTCAVCFSLPFSTAARKLYQSGAAISGWSGLRDVGRGRYVVITDVDVFPKGTVEIERIRILEGSFTDKVIAYTGSVIAASGSGLAGPFTDLIRRNGYSLHAVENFTPHDGNGMTAMVNGERVFVGGANFMSLMGIRLPARLNTKNAVFSAINGKLVGIFAITYRPIGSVQNALVLLMNSRLEPLFAIRDFNITPEMIQKKFKLPANNFKFPPYAERYRISAAEPDAGSAVAAVISRDGMAPLVEAAERGRRAHLAVRAATAVSVFGSVFGLLILFLLCLSGSFDSASVSNVLIFMLLWLFPAVLVVLGIDR